MPLVCLGGRLDSDGKKNMLEVYRSLVRGRGMIEGEGGERGWGVWKRPPRFEGLSRMEKLSEAFVRGKSGERHQ